MTDIATIGLVLRLLALIVLYAFGGFGIGFLAGMILANIILSHDKPTIMEQYSEAKRMAAQHNAQWDPSHERWRGASAPTPSSLKKPEE